MFFKLSDRSCDTGDNMEHSWVKKARKRTVLRQTAQCNAREEKEAVTPLTIIIQVRDQHLHQNAKGVTVPRVSNFLWKHFEPFVLPTTSFFIHCGINTNVAHILWVIAYLLLRRDTAGLSHTLNASEKLGEEIKRRSNQSVVSALQKSQVEEAHLWISYLRRGFRKLADSLHSTKFPMTIFADKHRRDADVVVARFALEVEKNH